MISFLKSCRFVLFLGCALLCAQSSITPVTITDIMGDGMVHPISSLTQYPNQDLTARTMTFISSPNNATTTCATGMGVSGCIRIGDATISTSKGLYIMPGQNAYNPESPNSGRYHLNAWYFLIQSGDVLTISYTN
jgi:hypothetical protein